MLSGHGRTRTLAAVSIVVASAVLCPCAFALNPALDVSQYTHTAWRVRDGFAKGNITSIVQTRDGYLWLGTEAGLLRFDGVRTLTWQPPRGERLPSDLVFSLVAARDGTLWIGTSQGLASWKDGQLFQYQELAGSYVFNLLEDGEGSIWATRSVNAWALCRIQKARVTCFGEDGGPGAGAVGVYEDRTGNLWVGTGTPTGIWRWRPGLPTFHRLPAEGNGIRGLCEGDDGSLLIGTTGGVRRLVDGQAVMAYPFPSSMKAVHSKRLLRDRDGGLWVGTQTRGLVHVHEGITDVFSQSDGLSGDDVNAIFEDREGTIWVATGGGLDRFRERAVVSYSVNEGLSSDQVQSVVASTDGSVWLGTSEGLNRWTNGAVTVYGDRRAHKAVGTQIVSRQVHEIADVSMAGSVESVFEDSQRRVWVSTSRGVGYLEKDRFVAVLPARRTRALVEDSRKNLWIAYQDGGVFRRIQGSHEFEQIAAAALKRNDPVGAVAADPSGDGVWFGFIKGGLAYFAGGQVRASYAASDGLAGGRVSALYADPVGTLWIAADGGLSRLRNGGVATLTSRNGLPCDAVGWVIEDTAHSLWLGMACGLVRIAQSEIEAWTADVQNGKRDRNVAPRVEATVFDQGDGAAPLLNVTYYNAPVARTSDGKLWFASQFGLSVVDPARLPFNKLPPALNIEQVVANRKTYSTISETREPLQLPSLIRDLQIDYTALSLVAPEKNRFRIKLEGRDREWEDVGTRRQAFYTDLGPGEYRFRVVASNNSGVWNETGATLDFSIAPAYYQTRRFAALVTIVTAALLWVAYRLRVAQLARQFHRTLDARVSERTRIARDLHDTLLQSFQGALLRFQSVATVLPTRPDEARARLDRALDQAEAAVTEGRNAVQGLRASATTVNDLANSIAAIGAELTSAPTVVQPPAIDVVVDGESRDLNPGARDEAYRIAAEALRNAVRHAQARRITVTIHYEPRQLRLVIRDDGQGFDADTMARQQVAGHFGLPGLHERAAIVRGQLAVRSAIGRGTEIELRVPASIAYATSTWRWSRTHA